MASNVISFDAYQSLISQQLCLDLQQQTRNADIGVHFTRNPTLIVIQCYALLAFNASFVLSFSRLRSIASDIKGRDITM